VAREISECGIVMSIRPRFAWKILSGEKTVEIRRLFSRKWKGSKITIYATGHQRSIVGEVMIEEVFHDRPENIWARFSERIGCTAEEFDRYTASRGKVYAIVLTDAFAYRTRVSIRELAALIEEDLQSPQNYCSLSRNAKWAKAVSTGALLRDRADSSEPFPFKKETS
jgi:predicted transcriptional regulator